MMKISYLNLASFTGSYKNIRYKVKKLPYIIGITGPVGSGKTLALEYFKGKYNIYTLLLDDLAKDMLKNNKYNYVDKDRFLNDDDLQDIKNNFHPKVWNKAKKIIDDIIFTEIYDAILMETALPSDIFFDICDKTICIQNNIEFKKQLLKDNRQYTDNKIDSIINAQKEYDIFYKKCDIILDNNTTKDDLYIQMNKIQIQNNLILYIWDEDISFDLVDKSKIKTYTFDYNTDGIEECKNTISSIVDK